MFNEGFKFWNAKNILKHKAHYYVIYGERSNGKTTGVLRVMLEEFAASGYKNSGALIRRWQEDYKGALGQQMVDGINALGWVEQITKGRYNHIRYFSRKWYLEFLDEEGKVIEKQSNPFLHAFSIASEEHYKSTAYPNITNILFDEFITRSYYLPDEFIKFQNLLSTIIRLRTDVKIFMCANTVNKYCPYFEEMGLTNIKNQKKDTIEIYEYGDSKLRVAVEYTFSGKKNKKSNVYFAFDNPKLSMITEGDWEINLYPHLPYKYTDKEILFKFFIIFDREYLQCEIINHDNILFMFMHRKTTEIKDEFNDIVFSKDYKPQPNYYRNITKPVDRLSANIYELIKREKVFYQDNSVGETFRNYLMWCIKKAL